MKWIYCDTNLFPYTIFTGVPYPAKFELPTTWSDTSYTLSWGVNCSINAPIINYQLSFKELPHGPWRSINIPGIWFHEKKKKSSNFLKRNSIKLFMFSAEMREVKNNAWYDNRYKRSKLVEFKQSYTIRGLTHGSRYKVSRFVGFTYFSLKTFSKTLQTF